MAAQLRHMAGQLDSLADQILDHRNTSMYSSSLRPGFEGCLENMNDPLYLRFVCLKQDEIFPEY